MSDEKDSQEVVINTCFGGFSLSAKGVEAYLDRQGKTAYWFVDARDADGRLDFKAPKVPTTEPDDVLGIAYCYTSPDADDDSYFSPREIDRDDPALVAVVRQLGDEAAGRFASLKIVAVPDGVEWTIVEYDGLETVEEVHRSWR